mmetsp:Transcript_36607/g.78099  ORF Transcript_36607/g.78099 Transcript_36607/m.78099 type:complete len:240 (+) Transcript_36607:466-1185(+)
MAATQREPAMVLPMVTGNRFFRRKAETLTGAPFIMPSGMMNMLATECSRPKATNAEIGNQIATIFPPRSLQKDAMYTAMHTSQLHIIPRTSAALKVSAVFAPATATEAPPPARVPPAVTSAAMKSEPTRLPLYDTVQDLMSCGIVALPSKTAAATRAVLPVKSSAPDTRVIKRPKGKPNAPRIIFCSPGLLDAMPGQAAPTESMRKAPKAMCTPDRMPSAKILDAGICAFLTPAATAPS